MACTYSIQCDRLRMLPSGEASWQALMLNSRRISLDDFVATCDLHSLLDDEETFEDWAASDQTASCYRSEYEGKEVFFLQSSGFEFFFTQDGKPPIFDCDPDPFFAHFMRSEDARILLPANSALTYPSFGLEVEAGWLDDSTQQLIGESHIRIVRYQGNKPFSAAIVDNCGVRTYSTSDNLKIDKELGKRALEVMAIKHSHTTDFSC